jgi:hypothetical protein
LAQVLMPQTLSRSFCPSLAQDEWISVQKGC